MTKQMLLSVPLIMVLCGCGTEYQVLSFENETQGSMIREVKGNSFPSSQDSRNFNRLQIVLLDGRTFMDPTIDLIDGNTVIISDADIVLRVPVDSIARVRTRRSSGPLRTISIGVIVGGAAGLVTGLILDGGGTGRQEGNALLSTEVTDYKIYLSLAGGALGGIIGTIIGSTSYDSSIDMSGRTVQEKKNVLVPFQPKEMRFQ